MTERQGEAVNVAWEWPESQTLSYKITPLPGNLMAAASVGRQLTAIAKLLEATEDGLRWKTLLRGIYTGADGTITFDLAITPNRSALSSQELRREAGE